MSDPHPTTQHPKSAACHLKVKGINSPPQLWGSASIYSSLKNLPFALWLPLSQMPERGSDECATSVLSCWDLACWILSCILGIINCPDMEHSSRKENFWYITGFSAISRFNNFLILIVHCLYNGMWVFCKDYYFFFLHACRSFLLRFFVTLFLWSALIFFSIWCLYESFTKEAALCWFEGNHLKHTCSIHHYRTLLATLQKAEKRQDNSSHLHLQQFWCSLIISDVIIKSSIYASSLSWEEKGGLWNCAVLRRQLQTS